MRFLDGLPRYVFFTGKGGVGKTSIACATAVHLADAGARVLLVSTDPASNLGQVFGLTIGNRVTAIPDVPRLAALEIDPEAAALGYRDRIVGPVRGVLPDDVVKGIEEQLSGACTTEIAAFDEFTALLTDAGVAAEHDHIVFDTAPTGHTIRLLQLPGAWSGFLATGKGDASCLGPLAGLEKQRTQYKGAVDALGDASRTRMVLVTRAQPSALAEVARTHDELSAIGITHHHLVVNGVLPSTAVEGDALAAAIARREHAALQPMPDVLQTLPRDEIALRPFNLVGLPALRALFTDDTAPLSVASTSAHPTTSASSLGTLVDAIAADGRGLVMVMGKGGVGKTTIAAAIATALARRGLPVHLTTSDPAARLARTLTDAVAHLQMSRIDPRVEIEHYRQRVLETKGRDLDAAGRALLEEDLRSPCTEEIAVFQAFARIIREARQSFVVMDTAPTGHTLLLLDATGAYHREVTRQRSGGLHFRTPLMQLQDARQTKVIIVTLAETTPVLEASALQADLRRAGIEPWAWVINQSLAAAPTTSPLLQQRAANERACIEDVARVHTSRYAVVGLQPVEPVGAERLALLAEAQPSGIAV
jgi:arsenite-transporting ATPase